MQAAAAQPWHRRLMPLWREFAAGPSWRTTLVQVGVFAVLAAVVAFGVPGAVSAELLAVLTVAACYSLLAAGTNISVGWLGSVTFGQAAFFGCGAYAVGLVRQG